MKPDNGSEVRVHLQKQTDTKHLSDNEFATKATASATRIKAWLCAQSDQDEKKAANKLTTIAEDESVDYSHGCTRASPPKPGGATTTLPTVPSPSRNKTGFAHHPGELVLVSPSAHFTNSDLSSDDESQKDVDMQEIAPWMYQEQVDAQVSAWAPRTTDKTPPSSLGRANAAGGRVPSKTLQKLRISEDDDTPTKSPNDSAAATPKTVTPGDRKNSLKGLFSPSPTLRRISSKVSFANLRMPSFKPEGSFPSETTSPLNRSFQSSDADLDSDSSSSTIGCAPYEDMTCGPAPRFQDTIRKLAPQIEVATGKRAFPTEVTKRKPVPCTAETGLKPVPYAQDIDSVRLRRGFRPLSVITDAVNYSISPFPSMDLGEYPPVIHGKRNSPKYRHATRNTSSETVILRSKHSTSDAANRTSSDECAATSCTSEGSPTTIHSDASTLFSTPPPLLSDHPINREGEDPSEIKTDYPLMTTSTPAHLIKALAKDANLLSTKSAGFEDDLRKKKSYRNLGGLFSKSAPATRLVYGSESATKNSPYPRSSDESAATPPSLTRAPTCESDSSNGKGLRKISTFFNKSSTDSDATLVDHAIESSRKKNMGIEKQVLDEKYNLGLASVENSKGKKKSNKNVSDLLPHLEEAAMRGYLERWLRNHLAYHRRDYKPGRWPHFPPHPNTGRAWDHANLRCSICIETYCGCCGKTCCAYRAMSIRLSLIPEDSHNAREHTAEVLGLIEKLYPVPKEDPTFLQCTECKKMTCPDCCGICPIEGCGDTECRKCKTGDAWNPCSWHEKQEDFEGSFESKACTEGIDSTSPMNPLAIELRKAWIDGLEASYLKEEKKGGTPAFWHHK